MGIRKIIITTEVEIDEENICEKYPNFAINFETKRNYKMGKIIPTKRGLKNFARRFINEEKAMRSFGLRVKVSEISLPENNQQTSDEDIMPTI
jgi:hypothetical protein